MKYRYTPLALLALCTACTKPPSAAPQGAISAGRIVINELAANGTDAVNEFGERADWFELYNPGNALLMPAGEWYVSDDRTGEPLKYELPEMTIPAEGHVVIWCDGADGIGDAVHTNFSLAPHDRTLVLVHTTESGSTIVDEAPIAATAGPDITTGRTPDGTAAWGLLSPPTPGGVNEELIPPSAD